jgi:putative membrane protein
MDVERFFTEQEKQQIEEAVIAAESNTAGEIVPIVVGSSARYTEVELLGVVAGLFAGVIVEYFWKDPWGSEYWHLWPVAGALAGFLLARIPAIKRLVARQSRIDEAVHSFALACFSQYGLHRTRDHTGILILVSLLEHRVEVLADAGINAKVESGTWQEVGRTLTEGLKTGRAADSFCKAIKRCGEILAAHFPRPPDDKDELPNRLINT